MQIFFYIISILGLTYFLLAKRKFDWFAVAFFSACIYFIPGFFGYTSYLLLIEWTEDPINNEAYGVIILVEIVILFSAIISDSFSKEIIVKKVEQGSTNLLNVILFLAMTGLLLMFLTTGTALFLADKQAMLDELNRSHILFYTATIIGGTMSFEYKKWKIFTFFCILIVFDLFIGFRMSLTITAISIFTLWLSKQGQRRLLISAWKPILTGIAVILFLFLYKQLAFAIKVTDFDLLKSLLYDKNIYSVMIVNSEPFVAQSILNEITLQDYSVGMGHLKGILYQFSLFAPELGLEAESFNDLFQSALFPEVEYGMANNIWAEMWSAGGWPLLVAFVLFFAVILKLFSIVTTRQNITLRSFLAVMASYWAFYIHRNDISYEIALLKRVLLVMVISFIVSMLIKEFKKIQKKPQKLLQLKKLMMR